jgi:NAD(P)-dependent dehydrogenase (short-subunit alcohol dehydrogenase family)
MDYTAALRLDGRGYVVLGAGQGIGRAVSEALAGQGAQVLCVDRDKALADEAARATGGIAEAADILSETALARVFQRAGSLFGTSFGGFVDIVGMADLRPITAFTETEWDCQFSLIVRHAFFALKHAAPYFTREGGTAVYVSSVAGLRSFANQAVYGAAKAALNHFIATAGLEFGPKGVRVNGVAPGLTLTPRIRTVLPQARLDDLASAIPLRRHGTPEDIAAAILFLSSSLSRQMTGVVLPVDGGLSNVGALPNLDVGVGFLKAGEAGPNQ